MRVLLPSALALAAALAACSVEVSEATEVDARTARYNAKLPKLGDSAPAFAALTIDGKLVDNTTIDGKTTLLNFWFYH